MDNRAESSCKMVQELSVEEVTEKAADLTLSVWPLSTFSSAPVDTSHTRTDLSDEQETIRVLSLEKAADQTLSVWPLSTFSSAPVDASHTLTDLSDEQETMQVPSLEKAADET
ncbi:hypothetical protein CVT25_013180, partial [Psilocybe cyanescens]